MNTTGRNTFSFPETIPPRRTLVLSFSIIILGLGVALFKWSRFGNDPCSSMVMAFADRFHSTFTVMLVIFNGLWFVAEILCGRQHIGVGTFINWLFTGFFADRWYGLLTRMDPVPLPMVGRILTLIVGMLVLSFAASLYQTADLGLAPFDALSVILSERTKIRYYWCRIAIDALTAVIAVLFDGLIGLGTVVCAFCLGPFVTFFTKTAAVRLCGIESKIV